jgi:cell shape-determining protein MreC
MFPPTDISTNKMDIVLTLLLRESKQLTMYEDKITSLEKENKSLRSSVNLLSKEVHGPRRRSTIVSSRL